MSQIPLPLTTFPDFGAILEHLFKLSEDEAAVVLRTLAGRTVSLETFDKEDRHAVYTFIGRDLKQDWTLTEEYLQKKTKDELVAIGSELKLLGSEWSADTSKKDAIIKEILAAYKAAKEKPGLAPRQWVPTEVLDPNSFKEVKK